MSVASVAPGVSSEEPLPAHAAAAHQRLHIPEGLLFNPHRDFTCLELRIWTLLDSGAATEVQDIAHRLGVHRVSVSRALGNLVDHGFAARKGTQYRNPRTGTYDILIYTALDGQRRSV